MTKVPLILPIVKEPSITIGNEIFNIHLGALMIYDPDLQVYTLYKVTNEHVKQQMTDQVFTINYYEHHNIKSSWLINCTSHTLQKTSNIIIRTSNEVIHVQKM